MPRTSFARACFASTAAALLALLGACDYATSDYRSPTQPDRQFLQLTVAGAAAASLPADGVSRLTLEARISPDSTKRTIQFTTTLGTLVGGTGTSATARQVDVDSSGSARIELQSSQLVGTARVTAAVVDVPEVAQSLDVAFVAADADAVLRFVVAPATAPADGATATTFVVEVSPRVDPAQRTVAFTTTAGSFAAGATTTSTSVPVGTDGRASVLLYSASTLGDALLTATVAGSSRQTPVTFERALPESLQIDLSKLSVTDSIDDSITLTVRLLRGIGTVTDGTAVAFAARDGAGAPFGLFDNVSASTGGTATATFSPAGSGVRGTATFVVRVDGSPASATASFQVTAPAG